MFCVHRTFSLVGECPGADTIFGVASGMEYGVGSASISILGQGARTRNDCYAGVGVSVSSNWGELIGQLVSLGVDVLKQLQPDYYTQLGEHPEQAVQGLLIGSLCVSLFSFGLISVMLGRSWQAKLYNPGGFQQEFHRLRLSRQSCLLLLAMMLALSYLNVIAVEALLIGLVPFSVAGLALVHGSVAKRKLGKGWLITFYVVSFLLGPSLMFLLVFLAVLDAWIDIRSRIPSQEN